jgi:hypothetical protein
MVHKFNTCFLNHPLFNNKINGIIQRNMASQIALSDE